MNPQTQEISPIPIGISSSQAIESREIPSNQISSTTIPSSSILLISPIISTGSSLSTIEPLSSTSISSRNASNDISDNSESDIEILFRSTPSPYLVLLPDSKFTIVQVNDAYLQITMTRREVIIGKGIFEIFSDNPSEVGTIGVNSLHASLERVVKDHKVDTMPIQKYDILTKRGFEECYWSPHNVPVFEREGRLKFIIHRVEDVTQFIKLKQQRTSDRTLTQSLEARTSQMEAEIYQHSGEMAETQEALRLSNERYSILTSILPVGVFHADQEGNCFYVNPRFQEITHVDLNNMEDKHWVKLVHPTDQAYVLAGWQKSILRKETYKIEFRFLPEDDQEHWVLAQIAPEIEGYQIKGYVGSLTDITERKELEEEKRLQAEKLVAIDQAKTTFFSNVSHEFRTPLTLMLVPLEDSLADEINPLNPTQRERQSLIYRNAVRLLKLVNSLLDFSRVSEKRTRAFFKPTDLSQLTADLASVFRATIEKGGLQLSVETPTLDEPVYVDREMYEKIIFNLLSNAFKFTFEGMIKVSLRKDGTSVELKVQDTGIGISSSELPHIFERFYRVTGARGRSYEGSGIGLALIKELIELHGGSISVESIFGRGTTFLVRIPLGMVHLSKERIEKQPSPFFSSQSISVSSPSPTFRRIPISPTSFSRNDSFQLSEETQDEKLPSSRIGEAFVGEAVQWLPTTPLKSPTNTTVVERSESEETPHKLRRNRTTPIPASQDVSPRFSSLSFIPDPLEELLRNTASRRVRKPKILVVDDNADMRRYIKNLLLPFWKVKTVEDGEEALNAVSISTPDLIITDGMMPKMDGFELVKHLRSNTKTRLIPIILLSARVGEEACVEGLQVGADDYLVKPFQAKELIARVKTHLELGQLRVVLEKKVEERTQELQDANLLLQQSMDQLKKTEAMLAKSETSYRILTSISPSGVFYCDANGKMVFSNERGYAISGLTEEQIERGNSEDTLHPDDKEAVVNAWKKFIAREVGHFKEEYRFLHLDGTIVFVVGEAVEEKDEKGQVKGYVGTITDISEMKRLERKRLKIAGQLEEQQRKRAEEAEKYRKQQEDFIDTMCHELRNPLNGIYGNIHLLESTLLASEKTLNLIRLESSNKELSTRWEEMSKHLEEYKASIAAIDSCARQQKAITDDVLNLSKLEAGKVILNCVDFDPKKVIQEALGMLKATFKEKNIHVYLDLIYDDVFVSGDPARLNQIFLNLLSNAVKFTPKNGKVRIGLLNPEAGETHTILTFKVEDTGIGMTLEQKNKIFDRFTQASRTTFQEYGGSGLGLVISKHLVELMHGTISVESERNQGTKITFSIRCKNAPKQEPMSPAIFSSTRSISMPVSDKRILIVDDNLINQRILKRQLDQVGYRCNIANHGGEAVDLWERERFDIILMDIEMPVMNGLEATRTIRRKEVENGIIRIPIIGISGNAREEHILEAKSAGMNDYLTKPYNKVTLLERIVFYTTNYRPVRR